MYQIFASVIFPFLALFLPFLQSTDQFAQALRPPLFQESGTVAPPPPSNTELIPPVVSPPAEDKKREPFIPLPSQPIDGSCSLSVNFCTSGVFEDIADSPLSHLWDCKGIQGGDSVSCSIKKAIPPPPTEPPPLSPTPPPPPPPPSLVDSLITEALEISEELLVTLKTVATQLGDFLDENVGARIRSGIGKLEDLFGRVKTIFSSRISSSSATGNLYVTVKKDGAPVPATDCLVNPLNGSFTGPSGTTSFTCLPHWYDKSVSTPTISAGHYTFAYTNGGPAGFTFQSPVECDPSDCNVPSGGTLSVYYNFTSSGGTIYQASTGFSSTNGSPSAWSYVDGKTGQKMTNYYAAGTFSECGASPCWRGSESYMLVFPWGQHPGANNASFRQWTSPDHGTAHITGTVKDVGGTCGGDGVIVEIAKAGFSPSWSRTITDGDTSGNASFDFTSTVNKDNVIFFKVSKGVNNYCDSTEIDPKIVFTATAPVAGKVTAGKVFLDVSTTLGNTDISLDGGTPNGGNPAVFNNVTTGEHKININVPAGMKAFWAICPKWGKPCYGPVQGGISGPSVVTTSPFTHSYGADDSITIFLTPPDMDYGSSIVPFKLHQIFNEVHAVSGVVPGRGSWVDLEGDYVFSDTCSRLFNVLDPTDTGDLSYLSKIAADSWVAQTYAKPIYERNKKSLYPEGGNEIPHTLINGKAIYRLADVTLHDSTNFVAYTDKYSGSEFWEESKNLGGTFIYGFSRIFIPEDEREYDNSTYFKYITGTDIILNPDYANQKTLYHEFGHAIGLGHAKNVPAVMTTAGTGWSTVITSADIRAVNALYPQCAPKVNNFSISLAPNPAQWQTVSSPQCGPDGNRINPNGNWWTRLTIQAPSSGNITLTKQVKKFFDASGNITQMTSKKIKWPYKKDTLTSQNYYILPNKKYVPARVEVTLSGKDDKGNPVQGTASVNLAQGNYYLTNPGCSGGGNGFIPLFGVFFGSSSCLGNCSNL